MCFNPKFDKEVARKNLIEVLNFYEEIELSKNSARKKIKNLNKKHKVLLNPDESLKIKEEQINLSQKIKSLSPDNKYFFNYLKSRETKDINKNIEMALLYWLINSDIKLDEHDVYRLSRTNRTAVIDYLLGNGYINSKWDGIANCDSLGMFCLKNDKSVRKVLQDKSFCLKSQSSQNIAYLLRKCLFDDRQKECVQFFINDLPLLLEKVINSGEKFKDFPLINSLVTEDMLAHYFLWEDTFKLLSFNKFLFKPVMKPSVEYLKDLEIYAVFVDTLALHDVMLDIKYAKKCIENRKYNYVNLYEKYDIFLSNLEEYKYVFEKKLMTNVLKDSEAVNRNNKYKINKF